jgi:predicted nuclease of predicted toxin-antitoxin system
VIKIVVDVGLPPAWIPVLTAQGWEAVHWSAVGDLCAPDRTIMEWARQQRYVVFTHDLDFGALLALSGETGPSVIQVRSHDVMPAHLAEVVVAAIRTSTSALLAGALVTVDESRAKVRILPITARTDT